MKTLVVSPNSFNRVHAAALREAFKPRAKLFDVVIYDMTTGKAVSFAGRRMQRDKGHHNAERRYETVIGRLGENYSVCILPTGKVKKLDDVVPSKYR